MGWEGRTYAALAVKISTLELEDERRANPLAKSDVNSAMRPRIKPMEWTLARTVIATTGSRQATVVVMIDVTRKIQRPEYAVKPFLIVSLCSKHLKLSLASHLLGSGEPGDNMALLDVSDHRF